MLSIIFYGCMDVDDNGWINSQGVLIPLAVGNYWVYEWVRYDSLGNETIIDTIRVNICNSTIVNGTRVYYWSWDDSYEDATLIANLTGGVYDFGIVYNDSVHLHDTLGTHYLWLKYPASVGETFYSSAENDSMTVVSISRPIMVPAGLFTCYEYIYDYDQHVYFAPNHGYICARSYDGLYQSGHAGQLFPNRGNTHTKSHNPNWLEMELRLIDYHISSE